MPQNSKQDTDPKNYFPVDFDDELKTRKRQIRDLNNN